jgi:hypothetical protein
VHSLCASHCDQCGKEYDSDEALRYKTVKKGILTGENGGFEKRSVYSCSCGALFDAATAREDPGNPGRDIKVCPHCGDKCSQRRSTVYFWTGDGKSNENVRPNWIPIMVWKLLKELDCCMDLRSPPPLKEDDLTWISAFRSAEIRIPESLEELNDQWQSWADDLIQIGVNHIIRMNPWLPAIFVALKENEVDFAKLPTSDFAKYAAEIEFPEDVSIDKAMRRWYGFEERGYLNLIATETGHSNEGDWQG